MFALDEQKIRRKPSLAPMIDVVFLLLVFFMLASRFGVDMHVPLAVAGQGGSYSGPPRLVEVSAEGLSLNGVAMTPEALVAELEELTESATDTVVLRPSGDATLQRAVKVMDLLGDAGFGNVVLVE